MSKPIYQQIASSFTAYLNCLEEGNTDWQYKHARRIDDLCRKHLPSGSGFDNGTELVFEESQADRLVFNADFHHMDEHGGYDGWTHHQVIVTPSLVFGIEVDVTGEDRNEILDYIGEFFQQVLTQITEDAV